MFDWYLRWRHGRGFGVHSPFAFDFIRSELRPPRGYGYYLYEQIPQSKEYSAGTLQLLFRVSQRLQPQTAAVGGPAEISRALQLACPTIRIGSETPDLLVVAEDKDCNVQEFKHLVILPPYTSAKLALWQRVLSESKSGMSFGGSHSRALVYVANPKLPRQDFDIRF